MQLIDNAEEKADAESELLASVFVKEIYDSKRCAIFL